MKKKRDYHDEESIARRTALFYNYVEPKKNLVRWLCAKYSFDHSYLDDNFSEVMLNFFKYMDTYNPEKNLQTWLHIVTKRHVMDLNIQQLNYKIYADIDPGDLSDNGSTVSCKYMSEENYREHYNGDILHVLDKINPIYSRSLVLQMAGYKLNEIMEISYREGNLKIKNLETVKSRLFLARKS